MDVETLIRILSPHGLRYQTKTYSHCKDLMYQYWFEGSWLATRMTEAKRGKRIIAWENVHDHEVAKLLDRFPELKAAA